MDKREYLCPGAGINTGPVVAGVVRIKNSSMIYGAILQIWVPQRNNQVYPEK
jgi:hypothetical protein